MLCCANCQAQNRALVFPDQESCRTAIPAADIKDSGPASYSCLIGTETKRGNLCLLGLVLTVREEPMMDMLAPKDPIRPSELVVMVTDAVYGAKRPLGWAMQSRNALNQQVTVRWDVILVDHASRRFLPCQSTSHPKTVFAPRLRKVTLNGTRTIRDLRLIWCEIER